jgi:hypothetical protein
MKLLMEMGSFNPEPIFIWFWAYATDPSSRCSFRIQPEFFNDSWSKRDNWATGQGCLSAGFKVKSATAAPIKEVFSKKNFVQLLPTTTTDHRR